MIDGPWRIGTLAREAGLSADTLRMYERRGLLPRALRTEGGFRMFPPAALQRVRVIQAALSVGFTLEELSAIFARRARGDVPCRDVRRLAAEKLDRLDDELLQLSKARDGLAQVLRDWDGRLRSTESGKPARLLESLAERVPQNVRRNVVSIPRRKEAK